MNWALSIRTFYSSIYGILFGFLSVGQMLFITSQFVARDLKSLSIICKRKLFCVLGPSLLNKTAITFAPVFN